MPVRRVLLRSAPVVIGAGGLVVAVVWAYLSMRTVMDVGGVCVSGRYATSAACSASANLTVTAVLGGFACFFLYALIGLPGPRLALLVWPALFLSLGWNFIDFARDPRTGGSPAGVWLGCGILFWLMGGLPLIAWLASRRGRGSLWAAGFQESGRFGARRRPRPPRNIDEVLATALPRQDWGRGHPGDGVPPPQRPPGVRAIQVYSVVLHLVVITSAGWLAVASFGWLTT